MCDLLECETVIKHFENQHSTFKVVYQKLSVIREVVKLLQIPFEVTQLLQRSDCTLSDFYGACIKMREKLKRAKNKENNKTDLAQYLLEEFENRRSHLINNHAMLSAVYLDRRFAIDLTDRETELAKLALCNLWEKIFLVHNSNVSHDIHTEPLNTSVDIDSDSEIEFDMSAYMFAKVRDQMEENIVPPNTSTARYDDADCEHQPNYTINKDQFLLLLNSFEQKFKLVHHKMPILQFWKEQKQSFPEIYALAQVLNGIPPSQATVERAFSALAYIYGPLRCRLSAELLTDILQIKLNSQIMESIFLEERLDIKKNPCH